MKCAQHIEVDAVGTCLNCGRGLCSECVSMFSSPLCEKCALEHNQDVMARLWVQIALVGILFVVGFAIFVSRMPFTKAIIGSLLVAFTPPGWNFLRRHAPSNRRHADPVIHWMLQGLRLCMAMIIGIVAGPVFLYGAWKDIQTDRDLWRDGPQK